MAMGNARTKTLMKKNRNFIQSSIFRSLINFSSCYPAILHNPAQKTRHKKCVTPGVTHLSKNLVFLPKNNYYKIMLIKICQTCKKPFKASSTSPYIKFCSVECVDEAYENRQLDRETIDYAVKLVKK